MDVFPNEELDEAGSGAKGASGAEDGGAGEAGRAREDANPAKLILVGVETTTRKKSAERAGIGEDGIGRAFRRGEVGERDAFDASDVVKGAIGEETGLGETDREGEIGDDAVGISRTRIRVEACGEIESENVGVFFAAEAVDLAAGACDGLAQGRLGAETEKAIQDDEGETMRARGFCLEREVSFAEVCRGPFPER